MSNHELAGKPVPESMILDIPALISEYYTGKPDADCVEQRVSFGTSGHRGTSLKTTFNEDHILAITQAICNYRKANKIGGPLFLGMDTHALSEPAHRTALEVLAANGVEVRYAANHAYTPTPVISHAILTYNAKVTKKTAAADGIVITPSHNPPTDGGFKYNPPTGGPADTAITSWIASEANRLLSGKCAQVKRVSLVKALAADNVKEYDFITPYVKDLDNIIDLDAIRGAGLRIGADALGGAGLGYWIPIAERYGLDLTLLDGRPDPTFKFMCVDHDGKIRMDCSSKFAMRKLVGLKGKYDIAFGNDPDFDRHGIVTPDGGLMNPNHYLAVAINYLFSHRKWAKKAGVGKTIVSSSVIDRVAASLKRDLVEVPVGFKWFVPGLFGGSLGFGGEESAGASFLRKNGKVWSTDKDGIILSLLAAEITAVTGKNPGLHYEELEEKFGQTWYQRKDMPGDAAQKAAIARITPKTIKAKEMAGSPIVKCEVKAAGNDAAIGGIKITTKDGWFAMRPSGTENICKIYAESFKGPKHLEQLFNAAASLMK